MTSTDHFAEYKKLERLATDERNRLEKEVRRAIAILGVQRVTELCAQHADARAEEACNIASRQRWRGAYRKLSTAFSAWTDK